MLSIITKSDPISTEIMKLVELSEIWLPAFKNNDDELKSLIKIAIEKKPFLKEKFQTEFERLSEKPEFEWLKNIDITPRG